MNLDLIKFEDGTYVLQKQVFWRNEKTKVYFGVPKGFVTDFVSTKILKFSPRCDLAALFHDVDYWYQEKSRKLADEHYRQNLEALGVGKLSRNLQFYTLRLLGWRAWGVNKKKAQELGLSSKILSKYQLKKATAS